MFDLTLQDNRWLRRFYEGEELYSPAGSAVQPSTIEDFERLGITYVLKNREGIKIYTGIARQVPLYLDSKQKQVTDQPFYEAHEIDEESIVDLLAFGYVTGISTLLKSVTQFRAGKKVLVKNESETLSDILEGIPKTNQQFRSDVFSKRLETVLEEVFDEASLISKDRTIVVPLSGGYDSRLLACLLRKAGIENVICVNYGVKGAGKVESNPSREAASRLGYKWHYVEYTVKDLLNEMSTQEFENYFRVSHGFVSTPHVQEYLLMKKLYESFPGQKFTFAPGHSADFSAGSHITPMVLKANKSKRLDLLVSATLAKHFTLRKLPVPSEIYERVRRQLETLVSYGLEPYMAFETWNWFERQSKFIVNSIRLYEFFGHNWWLPFWDRRFIEFWFTVPVEQKKSKLFYDRFVEQMFFEPMGVAFDERTKRKAKNRKSLMMRLATIIPSANITMKAKDFYMKNRYHNPWGMDLIGEHLLNRFTARYQGPYQQLFQLINNSFSARGYDPNCYLAEVLAMLLLGQDFGVIRDA
ncbi:MAG: hypothetical protein XD94_1648 [Mesotoga prima]|uniref:asparagine synthase (glutamine-hydrolyzing) n=1 Tax=Mesotoga prima TaxID=1184387 RepID=A0A101HL31_9BACT|nr:MAG: hypothetical protein XD94_1648 [Mesotoga prima]KUK92404.1 MAG: hypothetical protein XE05_1450 [Thermotogales bacterium 46_20]